MKVWLCAEGNYSDYHVEAIYSNEADAQLMTKAYGWNISPQAFELDPPIPSEARSGNLFYRVSFGFKNSGQQESTLVDVVQGAGYEGWYRVRSDGGRNFIACCWARDEAHAVKIAAERMAVTPRPAA